MQAKEFLTVAEHLLTLADEASHRTSISRSYYALYNQLYKEVSGVHGVDPGPGAHTTVGECVSRCKHIDLQLVAKNLVSLKADRIRADYKLGTPISKADAETSVLRAQKAFAYLAKFTPDVLEGQIRAAGI